MNIHDYRSQRSMSGFPAEVFASRLLRSPKNPPFLCWLPPIGIARCCTWEWTEWFFRKWHLCLIMVEVHPFKPTKDSTFTIWYLVSGRGDGLSIKENDKNPNWNGFKELPRMESLQAPLSWRTKSFFILQIEHSRSSSSTSLDQRLYNTWTMSL